MKYEGLPDNAFETYKPEGEDKKIIDAYKAKERELENKMEYTSVRQKIDDAMMTFENL